MASPRTEITIDPLLCLSDNPKVPTRKTKQKQKALLQCLMMFFDDGTFTCVHKLPVQIEKS